MTKIPTVFVISTVQGRLADLISGALDLGDNVVAICIGSKDESLDAFGFGATKVITLAKQNGVIFEDYAHSIAKIINESNTKSLILLPSDRRGKTMAAKLGVVLSAPAINDAISFDTTEGIAVKHRVYAGLAVGEELSLGDKTIATVGTGVFEPKALGANKTGEVEEASFIAPPQPITLIETKPKAGSSVDLGKAKRVVAVGRGFSKKEDISMAENLASSIGAEIGCSRPISEGEHWMERERYIGVSGQTLKSDVYFAVGISGQIQHLVGANDAKVIVAINKDKNAPIFKSSDYGIVGDLYKVLPAITEALKK